MAQGIGKRINKTKTACLHDKDLFVRVIYGLFFKAIEITFPEPYSSGVDVSRRFINVY